MEVRNLSSRTAGVGGTLVVAFLVLAAGGIWYILSQGWGLIFEFTYLLLLVIAFAIAIDRLFIR